MPMFQSPTCMNYHFVDRPMTLERNKIIFCKRDQIFTLNFDTKEVETIYRFETPLVRQPTQFVPNENQTKFMISSPSDLGIIDLTSGERDKFTNLQDHYEVQVCRSVIYDSVDRDFYIMANKYDEKLGFFILKVNIDKPMKGIFLIKWKNKLDIGDTSMHILRN